MPEARARGPDRGGVGRRGQLAGGRHHRLLGGDPGLLEDLGDRVRVTVAVYSESWLDRLLVRLPEDATVHDAQGTDLWRRRGEVARRIMIAAGIDPSADSVSA